MSGFIDLSNLFNIASNSLGAVNPPLEAENEEAQETATRQPARAEDSFQAAQTDRPRFDSGANNNARANNPLSVAFADDAQQDKNFTLNDFRSELNDIMGELSNENLTPEQRTELQDKVNDLMTNKFDQIQANENQKALAPQEEARVQKLAEAFDNAFNNLDDQIANNNGGGQRTAPLKDTAQRIRNALNNPSLADTARALRSQIPALKPDGASLARFAALVAYRRQAKLEQEALEAKLSSQVDRLMGVVKIKDSIKLASSTA
jgi:predicted Ser/Thr protein kinase